MHNESNYNFDMSEHRNNFKEILRRCPGILRCSKLSRQYAHRCVGNITVQCVTCVNVSSGGHLPPTAILEDYECIILTVLQDKTGRVYRYWYNGIPYVTVVATVDTRQWLVMFAYDGVLESAFVVERPEQYLSKPGFEWIGSLSEVDNEL